MAIFSHYNGLGDISNCLAIPALVFSIITPLVVLARFFARCTKGHSPGADDWTILASLCFAETVSIQMIICCGWGFGKHTKLLPPSLVTRTLELYFYAQILYKITIGLTKISILLLYLRVFGVRRIMRILCWTMVALVLAFTISSVVASIFQCSPVAFAYNKKANHGHGSCIDMTKFWYANAGFNIGSDAIIIVLPIYPVKNLNIPTRSKIALCGVFAVGIVVCITSILRFTTLNLSTSHKDIMWQSIASSMWTVIEYNLGIIAASMPALRRPLAALFPILLGRERGSSANGMQPSHHTFVRAPSTISSASTKTSRFSRDHRARLDDRDSQMKEIFGSQEDVRYPSGLRTEFYDLSSSDFNLEECERNRVAHGDLVDAHDWQRNHILKTTEVTVEPGSKRNSFNQYRVFPPPKAYIPDNEQR